jgi:hypothetical protein
MFIPDPGSEFFSSRGQKSTRSRIRIRNTVLDTIFSIHTVFLLTLVHVGLTLMSVCQRALSQFQADWTIARSQQVPVTYY